MHLKDITENFEFKMYHDEDPILHQPADEISPDALKDQGEFFNRMFLFMKQTGGIGLAAPQIGLPFKFFIMHAPDGKPRVCINPRVHSETEDQIAIKEGCLSYPGLYLTLRRPTSIMVSYNDISGNLVNEELNGMSARVFQHEYDHVNGIVFTDHASSAKLKMAKSKVKQNLKKMRRAGRNV